MDLAWYTIPFASPETKNKRRNFGMKKRMLCLLLVMVMCLGVFPVPSLAAAPYEGNHQGTVSVVDQQ